MANSSEYLSVAELAESQQKSKQWIYKLINNDPEIRKYLLIVDGKRKFRKAVISEYFHSETVVKPEDFIVATLKEQLAIANRQITDLTEALQREQLLHGQTAARLQQMTLLLEDTRKEPDKEPDPEPEPVKQPKRTLRQRFRGVFGRHTN